jgi:hypothetical protein
MDELSKRGDSDPALALLGHREALRQYLLGVSANRAQPLATWRAWDPVLGENLDGREKLPAPDAPSVRWRWTGSSPDTYLYFRLPRRTAFDLRIRLAPATPPEHAAETRLRLSGTPVPLEAMRDVDGRTELVATVPRALADSLPELTELHLHTARMLDEGKLVPYAGTRKLGLALESISAAPVSPWMSAWRRAGGPRLVGSARRLVSRINKS